MSLRSRLARSFWVYCTRAALALGQRRRAMACLDHLARLAPEEAAPHLYIATLAAAVGDPDRAEREVMAAIALDPANGAARHQLGCLLEERERFAEAEDHFRCAIELDASLYRAWYGLGMCLVKQGRLAEALRPLEEATRREPAFPHAWYQLARAHHDLGHGGEARQILARLERSEPRVASHLRRELELAAAFGGVQFQNSDRSHGW